MKIDIISVGKIKESYFKDGIAEYKKRLGKYCTIEEKVLADEPNADTSSEALCEEIKRVEGERILKSINPKSYVIALDLRGEMLDSVGFANKIDEIFSYKAGTITFIIGGSLGLSPEVIKRADYKLCFSKMTYPHKLMKLILFEAIYRAFKINNHETYHK